GGVLALTVPPLKSRIVGGHVSLWNAGLLLYNLVLAGFDCSRARILQYGYNISVILTKTPAELPRDLSFDRGDLRRLRPFLPGGAVLRAGRSRRSLRRGYPAPELVITYFASG